MGEELSDKTTSPARLRERKRRMGVGGLEPRDCFPNLYVLTKTTHSLKPAKAFTISWRRRYLDRICFSMWEWMWKTKSVFAWLFIGWSVSTLFTFTNMCVLCQTVWLWDCNWFMFFELWCVLNGAIMTAYEFFIPVSVLLSGQMCLSKVYLRVTLHLHLGVKSSDECGNSLAAHYLSLKVFTVRANWCCLQ